MPTVLITGCSSGFGLETAKLFLDRGWQVVATMRTPSPDLLPASERLQLLALDVTDADSIREAVAAAGPIDVLVNNAGVGLLYPLEAHTMDVVRDVFETNALGTIAMTRAVLPQFRLRGAGTIVNVTSAVTLAPMPLLAVYSGSKAAVNAFTESLALELAPLGIRTRLVVPGASPATRFGERARAHMGDMPDAYRPTLQDVVRAFQSRGDDVTRPRDVAEAVWQAATDPDAPARLPAGADAVALALAVQPAASGVAT
ncbi:SDR family oxidoreductase [Luteimonas abyssi]|uniref:SDR family oxidoreductase n=1 Tax=Luteimonas abyssi TaxID=1247514 RepID=UPI000737C43A|nr:SDR family oxidoreductase [Luteimonas abyssi]